MNTSNAQLKKTKTKKITQWKWDESCNYFWENRFPTFFKIIITIIIIDELVLILLNSFHPQSRHRLPLALRRIEIPKMNSRLCHRILIKYPSFWDTKNAGNSTRCDSSL